MILSEYFFEMKFISKLRIQYTDCYKRRRKENESQEIDAKVHFGVGGNLEGGRGVSQYGIYTRGGDQIKLVNRKFSKQKI